MRNLQELLANPVVKRPIRGGADVVGNILAVSPEQAREAGFPRCVFCGHRFTGQEVVWIGPAAAWCVDCGEDLARAYEEHHTNA